MDFEEKLIKAEKDNNEKEIAFWGFLQRPQDDADLLNAMLKYLTVPQREAMELLLADTSEDTSVIAQRLEIEVNELERRYTRALRIMRQVFNQHLMTASTKEDTDKPVLESSADLLAKPTIHELGLEPHIVERLQDLGVHFLEQFPDIAARDIRKNRIGEGILNDIRLRLRARGLHFKWENLDGSLRITDETPLNILPIDNWVIHRLTKMGKGTVGDIKATSAQTLLRIPGFYMKRLEKLRKDLRELNIYLKGEYPM